MRPVIAAVLVLAFAFMGCASSPSPAQGASDASAQLDAAFERASVEFCDKLAAYRYPEAALAREPDHIPRSAPVDVEIENATKDPLDPTACVARFQERVIQTGKLVFREDDPTGKTPRAPYAIRARVVHGRPDTMAVSLELRVRATSETVLGATSSP